MTHTHTRTLTITQLSTRGRSIIATPRQVHPPQHDARTSGARPFSHTAIRGHRALTDLGDSIGLRPSDQRRRSGRTPSPGAPPRPSRWTSGASHRLPPSFFSTARQSPLDPLSPLHSSAEERRPSKSDATGSNPVAGTTARTPDVGRCQ